MAEVRSHVFAADAEAFVCVLVRARACVCLCARRYRILKRRVTRTPKADINAFKATVARVDMDVGRMVGSRRAAPPANTRHFTTGLSPEDVAAMDAAAAAAAAAARGESDCDSDDGLDPYVPATVAQRV